MAAADISFTDDSESDSSTESLGALDDIIKNGGRKKTTIKKEESYNKKWEHFLLATTGMVINGRGDQKIFRKFVKLVLICL